MFPLLWRTWFIYNHLKFLRNHFTDEPDQNNRSIKLVCLYLWFPQYLEINNAESKVGLLLSCLSLHRCCSVMSDLLDLDALLSPDCSVYINMSVGVCVCVCVCVCAHSVWSCGSAAQIQIIYSHTAMKHTHGQKLLAWNCNIIDGAQESGSKHN